MTNFRSRWVLERILQMMSRLRLLATLECLVKNISQVQCQILKLGSRITKLGQGKAKDFRQVPPHSMQNQNSEPVKPTMPHLVVKREINSTVQAKLAASNAFQPTPLTSQTFQSTSC